VSGRFIMEQTSADPIQRMPKARLFAFYLPQFHPIPENDLWWGKGFTEWANVAKAKPLFPGHDQPNLPADLGFYDLRVPEVRQAQADLAAAAGIEGFCYWHYWFAGRRLLERPFNEVLKTGEPRFPFCLAWANQSWSGIWHGAPNRILMRQTYPGIKDYENHFYAVLQAFHDARYIKVDGKPLFVVFRPGELPQPEVFAAVWQELAVKNGLPGIHLIAHRFSQELAFDYRAMGFEGVIIANISRIWNINSWHIARRRTNGSLDKTSASFSAIQGVAAAAAALELKMRKTLRRVLGRPARLCPYRDAMLFFLDGLNDFPNAYPCLVPNWDNSPRSGRRADILLHSTPELFRCHVREALALVQAKPFEDRILFVKSWNEWAEGNYLEPDQRFGHAYLEVLRKEVVEDPAG
jgi:hypothetical protein